MISKIFFYLFLPCSFKRKLSYKSNRKNFFPVFALARYKHSRGWENSRQLCKRSTSSWVCITVSNSPNPTRVYIGLCKHGKLFLLLKYKSLQVSVSKYFRILPNRLQYTSYFIRNVINMFMPVHRSQVFHSV